MCWFHDIICVCGTFLAADDGDCANYLMDLPCEELAEEPEKIIDYEQLCWKCKLANFRWPEPDVEADIQAGYRNCGAETGTGSAL